MTEFGWHAGLDDDGVAEVRALADAAAATDGTAPLSDDVLLHLRGGDVQHLLGRDAGALVAFAHLDASGPAGELVVHPEHRRRGLGAAVVGAVLERAPSGPLSIWAHGEHAGAAALAERFGFTRSRVLWRMRRGLLDPLDEVTLPAGVTLRPFVVGRDEPEFLRVNNAAFDWHPDQGGWDVEQVELREAEPWFDPAGFLLAVDADDRLLGYHWTKVHPSGGGERGDEPIGEVYVLGVDPSARGMRLGRVLTLAGLRHLRGGGLREVMLYVEADNDAAVRVYRDLRFDHWDTDVSYVR